MNQRFLLITIMGAKCHFQNPKVGENNTVWVRIPFEPLKFVFHNNRTIHSYSFLLIDVALNRHIDEMINVHFDTVLQHLHFH